ncbi:MAG: arylsulfatase [Bacteroidia bacterium]|nr:arylsulfatase [Bacteroidia bacterium]
MRLNFIGDLLVVLILMVFLLSCSNTTQSIKHPNVVIVLSDDQGWGDFSFNGNPVLSTPNLDMLAKEGVSLQNFYVEAVCSPTRASLLTGRYAVRSGVYGTSEGRERMDLDELTFPEIFLENGYKTAAFGKWHNGMQGGYHPNSRGFEEFIGYCSGHWGSYYDAMLEHNSRIIKSEGFLTDYLTNQAIDFIKANKNHPFLVYLPLNTPHSPMQVPDELWEKFEDLKLPKHRYSHLEDSLHTRAAYAMVENIDWNVGRVVAELKKLNLEENTLIVYFSDNGPNGWRWNGGLKGKKGQVDEGGVKSPCFLRWKGKIKGGKKLMSISSVMDLFPTLLDLAGLENKSQTPLDGMSLQRMIESDTAFKERVIVNYWKGKTSIRTQKYRLSAKDELYELESDLGQTVDLRDSLPQIWTKLKAKKREWEREVLSELSKNNRRAIPIGGANQKVTHLPARDASFSGNINRSNRWPNCSFLTGWKADQDSIVFDVDVLEAGSYSIDMLFTCDSPSDKQADEASFEIVFPGAKLSNPIPACTNSPLVGKEMDRVKREESYVKEFQKVHLGEVFLDNGSGKLVLGCKNLPSGQSFDFRMLLLEKVDK